jgi:hypothetical protein
MRARWGRGGERERGFPSPPSGAGRACQFAKKVKQAVQKLPGGGLFSRVPPQRLLEETLGRGGWTGRRHRGCISGGGGGGPREATALGHL